NGSQAGGEHEINVGVGELEVPLRKKADRQTAGLLRPLACRFHRPPGATGEEYVAGPRALLADGDGGIRTVRREDHPRAGSVSDTPDRSTSQNSHTSFSVPAAR